MATASKAGLFKTGERSLPTSGKAQVFTTSGRCSECCTPYVLASFTESSVTTPALTMFVSQHNEHHRSRVRFLRKQINDRPQRIRAMLNGASVHLSQFLTTTPT